VVLAVGWGAVTPAGAGAGARTVSSDVTVAVRHDGQSRARAALRVARTSAAEVSATNGAYAYAACDDCRAVAVAFQVVLANRAPTDVAADNAAVAANEACERCETVAIAYQFVVVGPGRAQLTPAGRQRLAGVRVELHRLSRSDGSAAEIAAGAERLAAEVADVLTVELRTAPTVDHEVRNRR
jgi:hypothetical protein